MILKRAVLVLILLHFTFSGFALRVRLVVNRSTVGRKQPFNVAIKVSGTSSLDGKFSISRNPAFTVSESGISQSTSITMIQGSKIQRKKTFSKNYTFYPKRFGRFRIGPAYYVLNGVTYKTGTRSITVSKNNTRRTRRRSFGIFNRFFGNQQREEAVEIQIQTRIVPSSKTVYVSEEIQLYFEVLINEERLRDIRMFRQTIKGFWEEPGNTKKKPKMEEVKKNGKTWYRYRKLISYLYPASSGRKRISGLKARVYYSNYWSRQKDFTADDVEINVLPLPDKGRPEKFKGYVGDFKIQVNEIQEKLLENVPFDMEIVVSGKGNIQTIASLDLKYDKTNFRVLSPTIRTRIDRTYDGIISEKVFKYVVYPLTSGTNHLPSFSLSFFDPVKKRYRSVITGVKNRFIIKHSGKEVETGKKKKEKIDVFINRSKVRNRMIPFSESFLKVIFLLLIAGSIISLLWFRRLIFLENNPVYERKIGAKSFALNNLKIASGYLKKEKINEAIGLIEKTIKKYLLNKLELEDENILLTSLTGKLELAKLSSELIEEITDLLHGVSYLRYSAQGSRENVQKLITNSVSLISRIHSGWTER